jgi:predicted permease
MLGRLYRRVRALIQRDVVEREMNEEMRLHLERATERLVARGMPAEAARAKARREFGNVAYLEEQSRDARGVRWVEEAAGDLRLAVRALVRTPAFACTVILTLAVGIGATTVIFSVTDNVVLRALPYANADRLASVVVLNDRLKNVSPTWSPNAAHFLAWKRDCTSCEQIAALRPTGLTFTNTDGPAFLSAMRVSDNLLGMLGAKPEIGRLFAPGEDAVDSPSNIVISDAVWRGQFGARPDIVGKTIELANTPWTVIGVLSPDFHPLSGKALGGLLRLPAQTDAFVPLALTPREQTTPGEYTYGVITLPKRGVSVNAVKGQLDAISAAHARALQDNTPSRSVVAPLHDTVIGAAGRPLLLLLGAVAAMLLIICVNLANLFLARALARRRESAVRVALGAGRGRLVRQALAETVLLSCLGGLVGVALSVWGVRALVALAPADLPRLDQVHIDMRILIAAFATSIAVGLAFGLVPAIRAGGTSPGDVLKDGSRGAGGAGGPATARARSWLIASQIGVSAILLIVAGLFLKSFQRVLGADRGFSTERVLAMNASLMTLPGTIYRNPDARNQAYDELLRRIAALPGVTAVGLSNNLPLEGEQWVESVWRYTDGKVREKDFDTNFRFVSPNYFSLLGIPILSGRAFSDADRGAPRAVVSENVAQALWPGERAIGKLMHLGGTDSVYEVIGVVPNVRTTSIEQAGSLSVYTLSWERAYASTILVRTNGDPAALASSVRAAIRSVAPTALISRVRTMGDVIESVVAQRRFELVLIGLFALTALLTASIGIYGIISHSLGRRSNEIGIRLALGGLPRHVHWLVLREVFMATALGLAASALISVLLGRVLAGLLFEVRPSDPMTLVSVAVVLSTVAAVACWIPSRRATRLNPIEMLRSE